MSRSTLIRSVSVGILILAFSSVACAQAGKAEPAKGAADAKKLSSELAELREQVKRLKEENGKLATERIVDSRVVLDSVWRVGCCATRR